jgi:hypothetical protein
MMRAGQRGYSEVEGRKDGCSLSGWLQYPAPLPEARNTKRPLGLHDMIGLPRDYVAGDPLAPVRLFLRFRASPDS